MLLTGIILGIIIGVAVAVAFIAVWPDPLGYYVNCGCDECEELRGD